MKEDVSVCVCGVQRCPGAEEDVSELVCEGVFKHTADGWLLAYDEPSEAGTVKTLLRFADGRVTLTRRGAVRSEMTFAAGECHTIFYELPLGRLTMELHTDSVCASFDGACGTLELCYRLTVRDETVSEAHGHAGPTLSGKTLHSGQFCQRTKSESTDVVILL